MPSANWAEQVVGGDHHVPNGYLFTSIKDKINVDYNVCRQDTERARTE